jgi:hypothetical protein
MSKGKDRHGERIDTDRAKCPFLPFQLDMNELHLGALISLV